MLHLDEPLQTQTRLDGHVRALAVSYLVIIILDLLHESQRLQIFHDLLAAVEAVHAVVLTYVRLQLLFHRIHVQMRVRREDINGLQVIFLTERIVVHVVCRRHLQTTCTKADLHIPILDDRDHTTYTRYNHMLTLQPLVLLFLGVDAHCYIAEDRLRTRGSHDGVLTRFFRYFVAQVIELIMLVVINNLLITQCRLTLRIPVYHP